jgi:hypothetical protein
MTVGLRLEFDIHVEIFEPARRRAPPRRRQRWHEDRGDGGPASQGGPTRAPEPCRRTRSARWQAHRNGPCCGSVRGARAPASAAWDRRPRLRPSYPHFLEGSPRRPTHCLNRSWSNDSRCRSVGHIRPLRRSRSGLPALAACEQLRQNPRPTARRLPRRALVGLSFSARRQGRTKRLAGAPRLPPPRARRRVRPGSDYARRDRCSCAIRREAFR